MAEAPENLSPAMTPFALPTADDRPLFDLWLGSYHLPAVTAADELGLFRLLERQPSTPGEIQSSLGIDARAQEALLAVLCGLGFTVRRDGRFSLTHPAREFLLPESPYYWGWMLRRYRENPVTHTRMLRQLQGLPAEGPKRITDEWEQQFGPEQARAFTQAMHSHSFPAAAGVARWGDFSSVRRLLDVGGGSGCFCIALSLRYPEMEFGVLELPVVCPYVQEYAAQYGVQDRLEAIPADMFQDPWPGEFDALFFSNVFHDWGPERCRDLGRKAFAALPPGGRIYLHEMLLADAADGPRSAATFSLVMFLGTEGKQFTGPELRTLLEECGFQDFQVTPTYGYFSLVSARKPGEGED